MAVKNYLCEQHAGTEWFKNFEEILNEKYSKGWEFVRIYSLRGNEYTLLFTKIRDNGKTGRHNSAPVVTTKLMENNDPAPVAVGKSGL